MRKRRGAALSKPYAEMDDKEFRRAVMDECGFDPLSEALSGRKDIDLALRNLRLPGGGHVQHVGTDWLVRKYKADGRVDPRAVQAVWAGLKLFFAGERDAFGRQVDITVPFEMADIIGSTLAGQRAWRQVQKRVRAAEAEQEYKWWQEMADKIWRSKPSLSVYCVAEMIAERLTADAPLDKNGEKVKTASTRTIRGKIHKPEK